MEDEMYCCAPELIGLLLKLKVWVVKVKPKSIQIEATAGVQIPKLLRLFGLSTSWRLKGPSFGF
jgi:hypothetical protein